MDVVNSGMGSGNTFKFRVTHKTTNTEIPSGNIRFCKISEHILCGFPTLEMELNDPGNFSEDMPLQDNDVLEIYMASTPDEDGVVMEFVVSDHRISPIHESQSTKIFITGTYNAKGLLYPPKNRGVRGTSSSVLTTLSGEMGLGIDIDGSTEDAMMWYQRGNAFAFMKHLINRSHKSLDTMVGYISMYDKLHFRSLVNAISKKPKFIAEYNIERAQLSIPDKLFDDHIYFQTYDFVSVNGKHKTDGGYGFKMFKYDGKGGEEIKFVDKSLKMADLENISPDVKFSSYENAGWSKSNPNVFGDYDIAPLLKKKLLGSLMANSVVLNANGLSDVRLMDGVTLHFPSFYKNDTVNSVYSGNYIVTKMIHVISNGNTYTKNILLSRIGINKSDTRKVNEIK